MKAPIFLAAVLATCFALPVENHDERIVGGYPAGPGRFPHQVSLQTNGQHNCGGSIISDTTILTAAQCIHGSGGQVTVVAGVVDLFDPGVRIPAAQYLVHSQYDPATANNDIALIRLATRLPLGNTIWPVKLRGNDVNPGESLALSGWGRTSYPGNLPRYLQWTPLQGIDLNTCRQRLIGGPPITDGNLCTGSPVGQGACQGDAGSPLIDGNYGQIGIVSWGVPCARGFPDVFTSVPYYLRWIIESPTSLEWKTL